MNITLINVSTIINRIIGYAKCGLLDGLMIDSFTVFSSDKNGKIDNNRVSDKMANELMDAYEIIFTETRKHIPDDFLILVNGGFDGRVEKYANHINGSFMECGWEATNGGYLRTDLLTIEKTLTWNEHNLRFPQINCLEGFGFPDEVPDSKKNRRWMRVFTTLSLTHSNGYVLYNFGIGHNHIWYDFWNADLGEPIGGKSITYQNQNGLFIREFTHGWAVYNRSGSEQEVVFESHVSGKSSEITALSHTIPDMDGEIYLKIRVDVNNDGIVNILDLVVVANNIGKQEPDINGDGIVNILDLVLVSQGFTQ